MASVSSLLRSAAAARERVINYQDSTAAFQYQLSAKTQQDWEDYQSYLQNRLNRSSTAQDQLSYLRTLNSAENSYVSQEIERASIAILDGSGSNTAKFNTMLQLQQEAARRGNADLVQNLQYRLLSLQETIQNEYERQQRAAATMAMNRVSTVSDLVKKFTESNEYIQLADGTVVRGIAGLDDELKQLGTTQSPQGLFGEAANTLNALQSTMLDIYNSLGDPDAAATFVDRYNDYFTGDKKFKIGGQNLTYNDVILARDSAYMNNPLYSPVQTFNPTTGQAEFKLEKNKVDDLVWAVSTGPDGQQHYQLVQTRTQLEPSKDTQGLSTIITDDGYVVRKETTTTPLGSTTKYFTADGEITDQNQLRALRSGEATVANRLKLAGYTVMGQNGQTVQLSIPGAGQVEATVMPGGKLRYAGQATWDPTQSGIYEIDSVTGQIHEIPPDEYLFARESNFGGSLGESSGADMALGGGITGAVPSSQYLNSLQNNLQAGYTFGLNTTSLGTLGTSQFVKGFQRKLDVYNNPDTRRVVIGNNNGVGQLAAPVQVKQLTLPTLQQTQPVQIPALQPLQGSTLTGVPANVGKLTVQPTAPTQQSISVVAPTGNNQRLSVVNTKNTQSLTVK